MGSLQHLTTASPHHLPRQLPGHPAGCDYCGLPVTGLTEVSDEPRFCCVGCRFAASITGAGGEDAQARWIMARLGMALFFTMNVMVFTMLLWSQEQAAGSEDDPAAVALYALARHACLLFTAPVLVLLGGPLLSDAIAELRRGRASLNMLLFVGVVAAFAQSAWATWSGAGHVYFEVSCMVLLAVTLGRWLEASGKLRTTAALRELRTLLPDRARRQTAAGESEVALELVGVGDLLRILPGEYLPTDGRITAGQAAVDERTVTGEAEPAVKIPGDAVYSGTCNLDGELLVEVTAAPGGGTLERLIDAVSSALAGGRQQRLAEQISAWFLPLVVVVAAATCFVHWRISGSAAGILAGLAVVVVSCPCALGLATPMALWAAAGAATRRHILIRDGDAFARLAAADLFCFDKTGTLTTGCCVTGIACPQAPNLITSRAEVLAIAGGLSRGSTHVFSRAIAAAAQAENIEPPALGNARSVAGCGVEGMLPDGTTVRLGSPQWIEKNLHNSGESAFCWPSALPLPQCLVAVGSGLLGGIYLAERIRPEAADTLTTLRERGVQTLMLSGDRLPRASAVAAVLGLECRAPLLPAEKLAEIEAFQRQGRCVVMVGDGINDAPALTAADVGVALGCGADVSRWSADICLLRDDLSDLPWLVDLARRSASTIRWNLLWAFGYNAACIPLAATGWVHPAIAAAAMVASSLFIVTNSLRLTTDPPPAADQPTPAPTGGRSLKEVCA